MEFFHFFRSANSFPSLYVFKVCFPALLHTSSAFKPRVSFFVNMQKITLVVVLLVAVSSQFAYGETRLGVSAFAATGLSDGGVTGMEAPSATGSIANVTGVVSDVPECPAPNCSSHGVCDHATGTCVCRVGFFGKGCERILTRDCENGCSGHGRCLQGEGDTKGQCRCFGGCSGDDCAKVRCPNDRSGHGDGRSRGRGLLREAAVYC